MSKIRIYIKILRLRTLSLSLSGIILGTFLSIDYGEFNTSVFLLASTTAIFLQILSNVANELGDYAKGVDDENRKGPIRALQGGNITVKAMKQMLYLLVILSLLFGVWLIYEGTKSLNYKRILPFLILGIVAIVSALKYTLGNKPFGYRGLGDLFVFIFFGLVSVLGTFFLHTHQFEAKLILPAISLGMLSTGVLNLNNLRDIENDKEKGKRTLIVILGAQRGKYYYAFLILTAILSAFVYYRLIVSVPFAHFLFIICLPVLINNIIVVLKNKEPYLLNKELPRLSIITFLFSILFGIGLII